MKNFYKMPFIKDFTSLKAIINLIIKWNANTIIFNNIFQSSYCLRPSLVIDCGIKAFWHYTHSLLLLDINFFKIVRAPSLLKETKFLICSGYLMKWLTKATDILVPPVLLVIQLFKRDADLKVKNAVTLEKNENKWNIEKFAPFLPKIPLFCLLFKKSYNNCEFLPLIQFSSVAQSCPTLCHPMDYSTPGLPVHHQLLEFTQTHVHRVGDAIQPSHPLLSPSLLTFNLFQHQGLSESILRIRWPKYWSFSFNINLSNECSGLISFRMDWLDLLTVQGTLKSLLQHHSSKAFFLQRPGFFIVKL